MSISVFKTRAGLPPTIELDSTSSTTTELAAIITLSPIVTPPIIAAPEPILTLEPSTGNFPDCFFEDPPKVTL